MSSNRLAILGGQPTLTQPLAPYPSIGEREAAAVARVMKSGSLSGFYGSWGDEFLGGPVIKAFEQAWSDRFQVKHSVTVNSATSGLIAAIGACGVTPGDEVIVSPYTMSASAIAPLFYGGIPVFADIEPDTFTLDVEDVKRKVTSRTRAIIAVNIFGHPAALGELRRFADERGIKLIEDNAQAPLATEGGKFAGTVGHVGVFSLNYHKHVHTGEGGVCVTNDDDLARRMQMIRNHAENIVEPLGIEDPTNLLGFNFRMTEMSAAVGLEQLAEIEPHVRRRQDLAERLTEAAMGLEGVTPSRVRSGCRHVYYLWTMRVDEHLGVSRKTFSAALSAEGFPNFVGYLRPLYMLPVFQKRVAFGGGYPFNLSNVQYREGDCPVAERMWRSELVCFETCASQVSTEQAAQLGAAIRKVHAQRAELRALDAETQA